MSSEFITTYLLDKNGQPISDVPMPMEREKFYEEQIKVFNRTGKSTRAVEIVQLLLFTPEQEIILQRRSPTKHHNPGLIDKSVGGHITFGDTPTYTLTVETIQELNTSSFILATAPEFKKTYLLLKAYLANAALVQFIDSQTYLSTKLINNRTVQIANKYHFYCGVYKGSLRPADKEASGIMFYKFAMLQAEIEQNPEHFTADLRYFLARYNSKIKRFITSLGE